MRPMRLVLEHGDASAVRLSITAAMVIVKPVHRQLFTFSAFPTFAKKCQQKVMTVSRAGREPRLEGETLPSDSGFLTSLRLELAYFSGVWWLRGRGAGGAGAILRFERVRPRRRARFQPLSSREITPEFLDRTIRALKRWNYDIVSIDEVCQRATMAAPRRFVGLTFDGAYKDLVASAYPVLS